MTSRKDNIRSSSNAGRLDEETLRKMNVYPFEESGLVGEPVPQSRRDVKSLTETGEIRLARITDEVRREAERVSSGRDLLSEAALADEPIDGSEYADHGDDADGFDPWLADIIAETSEVFASESFRIVQGGAGVPEHGDDAAVRETAPGQDAVLDEREAAPSGEGAGNHTDDHEVHTDDHEAPADDHDTHADGLETTSAADAGGIPAGSADVPSGRYAYVPYGGNVGTPTLSDTAGSASTGFASRPGAADDGSSRGDDFSAYRGKYARLNEITGKHPRIQFDSDADQTTAADDAPAASVADEIAGYGVVEPGSILEREDEEVSVHPRELLSASMYDDLINWGSRLARETPLFQRAFTTAEAASVCDVGCGSGRHSIMFAEWGMKVIGVESSNAMLKRARANAEEAGEHIAQAKGEVTFKKGALGSISEITGLSGIDAITCVGDVLPRVPDIDTLRAVLDDFGDALVPAGTLVLEFTNNTRYFQNRVRNTSPVVFDTVEGTKVFLSVMDYPAASDHIDVDMLTLTCNPEGRWRVRCERAHNLSITATLIERELLDAGFDIMEISGDYAGKPLDGIEDESMIVVARRKHHRPAKRRRMPELEQ